MNPSQPRSAVVLVIDHLGANRLGPYGNTCYETHHFNRLAAQSILFDQAMTESTDLKSAYRGLWNSHGENGNQLIEQIGKSGIRTSLFTDEPILEQWNLSDAFDRVIPIPSEPAAKIAATVGETELARFFAQATDLINEWEPGHCCWLHSRGLGGAWDAPYDLRERLADSDDPVPPDFHQPPQCLFNSETDDPDELLGYQQVSAAQVVLIDEFLGVFLDALETNPAWQSTLLCVLSTRGFPLGEHGLVGSAADGLIANLYNESVHVPMMVCLPGQTIRVDSMGIRNGSLVQPGWVSPLLTDWFANSSHAFDQRWESTSRSFPDQRNEFVVSGTHRQQAIQTHAWKLIRTESSVELYVKPDDLWEVNDVSRRCPQIVEQLCEILDQRADSETPDERIELSEELAIRVG